MPNRDCYCSMIGSGTGRRRVGARSVVIALIAVAMAVAGTTVAAKQACTDLSSIPSTDKMVFAVKDDVPLIIIDLGPELEYMAPLDESCRKIYVQKRILATVAQHGLGRDAFHGFDRFMVKAVIVIDFDNYDQPQWFLAPQLATVEVKRQQVQGLTVAAIYALDDGAVADYVKIHKMEVTDLDY